MSARQLKIVVLLAAGLGVLAFFLVPKLLQSRREQEQREKLLSEAQDFLEKARESREKNRSRDYRSKAARALEEALQIEAQDPDAQLSLARVYFELGSFAKSSELFAQYVEGRSADADVYREAGLAWKERWVLTKNVFDRGEAVRLLEQSLAQDPNQPKLLFQLGWIFHQEKDLEKRDVYWSKLAEQAPDSLEHDEARALSRGT